MTAGYRLHDGWMTESLMVSGLPAHEDERRLGVIGDKRAFGAGLEGDAFAFGAIQHQVQPFDAPRRELEIDELGVASIFELQGVAFLAAGRGLIGKRDAANDRLAAAQHRPRAEDLLVLGTAVTPAGAFINSSASPGSPSLA